VRNRHGLDEVLLEHRLHRRLDLLDAAHDALDLVAGLHVEQRDARALVVHVSLRFSESPFSATLCRLGARLP